MLRYLFAKNQRLKAAFAAVKTDMECLEDGQKALTESTNEWIMFLDKENRDLKMRVNELESQFERLEAQHRQKGSAEFCQGPKELEILKQI